MHNNINRFLMFMVLDFGQYMVVWLDLNRNKIIVSFFPQLQFAFQMVIFILQLTFSLLA